MDSSIQEYYPTANPGSGFELEVVRNPGAGSRAFLLRFDLSGWVPGSYSTAATIEFTNFRDQGEAHAVNAWGIADGTFGDSLAGLDEGTVTWNTAPGLVPDGLLGDDEDVALNNVFLGSFDDGSMEGVVDAFSTAALLAFLNADTNGLVVFLFTTPTPDSNGQVYASREATSFSYRPPGEFAPGTHAPQLTFTATPVPELTTGTLFVLGLLLSWRDPPLVWFLTRRALSGRRPQGPQDPRMPCGAAPLLAFARRAVSIRTARA